MSHGADSDPSAPPVARTCSSEVTRTSSTISSVSSSLKTIRPELIHLPSNELLRAVPVGRVLHHNGKIFKTDASAIVDAYHLSMPCDHIDSFVSHNWSTPRRIKFFTLALHFNLDVALFLSLAVAIVVCALCSLEWLPLMKAQDAQGNAGRRSVWCYISGYLTLLTVAFRWHEVAAYIGFQGSYIFFDKACIHQVDPVLKRQGIEAIGAYLYYSWSMTVVYNNMYFKKLWTVYEVAAFLTMNPNEDMIVVPTFHILIILGCSLVYMCTLSLHLFVRFLSSSVLFIVLVPMSFWVPAQFCAYLLARRALQYEAEVLTQVATFDVYDTVCSDESDRPVVYENIADLMRAGGHVEPDASKSEALQAFNNLARKVLPKILFSSFGIAILPYRYWIFIYAPSFLFKMDEIAGMIADGEATKLVVLKVMVSIVYTFAFWPLVSVIITFSAKVSLMSTPIYLPRRCLLALMYGNVVIMCCGLYVIENVVDLYARSSRTGLLVYGAFALVALIATLTLYGVWPRRRVRRRCRRLGDAKRRSGW